MTTDLPPSLLVAPCTFEAARYAVTRWHYSGTVPAGAQVRYGVWEHGRFVGAILYGRSATPDLCKFFAAARNQVCELTRVALREHETPVSQLVAATLRLLEASNPGLRAVMSYADERQGHHGGIYQAGNWLYFGVSHEVSLRINGRLRHKRSVGSVYGTADVKWLRANVDPTVERVPNPPKHRYAMPLDRAMRRFLLPRAQPYPGRDQTRGRGVDGDTPDPRSGGAGSTPAVRST